ncbi:MAG TPA: DMT family transporter [Pseudonocardiaceae bacterium]|nr:DMT family transporter [Pseudonocardiaceae bacterium]
MDTPERTVDRTWLVAISAALWGTDALLRKPLADALPAATVVWWEHAISLLVLLPWLPGALRAFRRLGARERIAVVLIGVGASAVATALFTQAFALGDPVTPLVLQKFQPVFAMLAAYLLLGERLRSGYLWFAVPALAGAWLLTFPDPFQVSVTAARSALLALAAAALWAGGTVLGRLVSTKLTPNEVTVLRYFFGFLGASAVVAVTGSSLAVHWGDVLGLALLALVPGLLALRMYYVGLRSTPAARATLAELAFPATAAVVGVTALGATLSTSQWIGFAVVVLVVTGLSWHEHRTTTPVVAAPAPKENAEAPARWT